jgi:transcriptional regulator CtsR
MKLVVNPKTRKQEKAIKEFLDDLHIEFTMAEEEQAVYKITPKKQLTKKEKQILDNLSQSVDFVLKYNKGKVRAKSFNQLLNEL